MFALSLAPLGRGTKHLSLSWLASRLFPLLFIVPKTMRLGAAGLLLTLSVALVAHLFLGQFRADLLLYAVAVAFVAVHGSLSAEQWRRAGAWHTSREPASPESS